MDHVFESLSNADEAHEYMLTNANNGKIVLVVRKEGVKSKLQSSRSYTKFVVKLCSSLRLRTVYIYTQKITL